MCEKPEESVHFILFSEPYYAKIKSKAPVFTKPQTAIEKELQL
jgi:hypothetical protein